MTENSQTIIGGVHGNNVIGAKIVAVRRWTKADTKREYSDEEYLGQQAYDETVVIELDNGILLFPSRDSEGNGPGVMFGHNTQHNVGFWLRPPCEEETA